MHYVYILRSGKNGSFYIGYTRDINKRLREHNAGKSRATKPFRPYQLIFYEVFLNVRDAKGREQYLKSGWGGKTIRTMLKYYLLD